MKAPEYSSYWKCVLQVKYRKHKKGNRVNGGAGGKAEKIQSPPQPSPIPSIQTGKILKAALTSPNEVTHLRQPMPFETAAAMITNLVQCDNFHDIAALQVFLKTMCD